MNKIKVLMFILIAAMLVGIFSSCGEPPEKITVRLIITAGDDEILDVPMVLEHKEPTVLSLFKEAAVMYEINYTLNSKEDSVLTIEHYVDYSEGGIDYFWEYTKDGQLPDNQTGGKANDDIIKDGQVINYIYSTYDTTTAKK